MLLKMGLSRFSADAVLPMGSNEPGDADDEDEFDAEMEAVKDFLEAGIGVPGGAKAHADVSEGVAPGPGADEGVEVEAELVHPGNAGGKGNKGADNRKHAADEDGDGAEPVEEVIDQVKIAAAEKHVAAIALYHGPAAAGADPVGRNGAYVGGERGNGGKQDELGLGVSERVAGKRHDDLRRNGDAGRLNRHEEGDGGVAATGNKGDKERKDFF